MRWRNAGSGFRGVAQIAVGGAINLHWLVEPFHEHRIRLLLVPFEAALLAVNTDVDVILLADADLRNVEHPLGAALKAERVTLAVRTNGDDDEEERMLSWRRKRASVDGHDGGCSVRLPLGRATGVGHSGEFEVAWRHGAEDVRRDYEIAVERLVSQLDKVLWRLAHVEETPGLTLLR